MDNQTDLRTPMQKFEDLARRAFQTPKAEVDARMAEDKAKRKQAKEKQKVAAK